MKKLTYPLIFLPLLALFSCEKETTPTTKCAQLSSVTFTKPASANIGAGETLTLNSNLLDAVTYRWTLPGEDAVTTASAEFANIDFNNEGWIHFTATNNCNEVKKDSFYLNVTVPSGTASCTSQENYISLTALNHQSHAFTTIGFEASAIPGDTYTFGASGTYNELKVLFHPSYNSTNQPESGAYTTMAFNPNNYPVHGEKDYDKVFVVLITYSPTTIYYRSVANQKVYVSRENGKVKVKICDMSLQGSSQGVAYTTNMTASAIEP